MDTSGFLPSTDTCQTEIDRNTPESNYGEEDHLNVPPKHIKSKQNGSLKNKPEEIEMTTTRSQEVTSQGYHNQSYAEENDSNDNNNTQHNPSNSANKRSNPNHDDKNGSLHINNEVNTVY